jgi:hypothetical protein
LVSAEQDAQELASRVYRIAADDHNVHYVFGQGDIGPNSASAQCLAREPEHPFVDLWARHDPR